MLNGGQVVAGGRLAGRSDAAWELATGEGGGKEARFDAGGRAAGREGGLASHEDVKGSRPAAQRQGRGWEEEPEVLELWLGNEVAATAVRHHYPGPHGESSGSDGGGGRTGRASAGGGGARDAAQRVIHFYRGDGEEDLGHLEFESDNVSRFLTANELHTHTGVPLMLEVELSPPTHTHGSLKGRKAPSPLNHCSPPLMP
jgi:hypothetical protein